MVPKTANLNKVLDDLYKEFDDKCEETLPNVPIHDLRLKEALSNQVELQLIWERLYAKVKQFHDVSQNLAEEALSDAINAALTDNYKKVSITEAKELAKKDSVYRKNRRLEIDSSSLLLEIKAILETITSRKYILNNITNAVVSSQENHII